MYDYTFVNVVMQISFALMLGVVLASQLVSADKRNPLNRIFLLVTSLILAALLADAVAWGIDTIPGAFYRAAAIVSNFLTYSLGILGTAALVLYIVRSIPLQKRSARRVMGAAWFIAAAFIALVVANQFTGWIYYIDADNMWHMGPVVWAGFLAHTLIYLIIIFVVIQHRKLLGLRQTISYISYAALPIIAVIINTFYIDLMTVHASWALSLLVIYANIHIQRERLVKEQELELQNQRFAIMLSQIQPHFLYNSLTVIQQLCKLDPKEAEKTVNEFSAYLRGNLESLTENKLIPFEQELHHVQTYLSIEKKRFGDKLNVVYDIGCRDFKLPALTLQPIVENAVRYGVTKKKQRGTVTVQTEQAENEVIITVTDDGVGFDPSVPPKADDRSHVGIENVKGRLAAMCGGTLNISSKPGTGTAAVITIPKRGAKQ